MRFLLPLAVVTASIFVVPCAWAQNAGLGQLYPSAPPEGSSFVRVVNPLRESVQLSIGGVEDKQALSAQGVLSTNYKMINPSRPLQITINGRPVANAVKVEPNTFMTLVVTRVGSEFGLTGVQDSTQGHNALKADLRVYNLATGCTATVATDKGQKVFDQLALGETRRRAINPVAVALVAQCGTAESAPFSLPQLSPGTRYSLFVIGEAAKPVLEGKIDAVE